MESKIRRFEFLIHIFLFLRANQTYHFVIYSIKITIKAQCNFKIISLHLQDNTEWKY